jgi:NADH:ubiquinone oxidoreductase subunit E
MNSLHFRERAEPIIAQYPRPQMALAPLLHFLLDAEEHLTDESLHVLAEICQVHVPVISEMIASYPILRSEELSYPSLCTGLSCYLQGAQELYAYLKSDPSLIGEDVRDISSSSCFGHCYAAPVIKLSDGDFYKIEWQHSRGHGSHQGREV